MKVLISAGVKTENIVKGIEKKFRTSGDEFNIVQFIEDIDKIFARGEYFDKAIIVEQSITREYEIEDEDEIRKRINEFANTISKRGNKFEFVFLTQDYDLAEIIYEEILPIIDYSAVVLAPPPYQVKFFTNLVVVDVKQLDPEIVYKPKMQETPIPEMSDVEINDEELQQKDIVVGTAPEEFDVLFNNNENLEISKEISDDTGVEQGIELDGSFSNQGFNFEGFEDEQKVEQTENIDNSEPVDTSSDFNTSDEIPITDEVGSGDIGIDFDNSGETIQSSGNLPDYTKKADNFNDPLIGFDTDFDSDVEVSEKEIEQQVEDNGPQVADVNYDQNYLNSQETYQGQQNQLIGFDTTDYDDMGEASDINENQSINGSQPGMNEQYNQDQGFDQDMYSQDTGFSADDYSGQEIQQDPVDQQYNGEGFDPNYYNTEQYQQVPPEQQFMPQQPQQPIQNMNVQPEKRGIFGVKKGGFIKKKKKKAPTSTNKLDPNTVKENLRPFATRGNGIVVTGCGGCGTSVIAYNLANIICQLGYTVLLVDMDTQGKTQSYISKTNYESMEVEDSKLLAAVNSSAGIGQNISIVKQGFHLATMGLATDSVPVDTIIKKEKLPRFINSCKSSHNFVIYDVPFLPAIEYLEDVINMADNLVLVADASTWGLTKMMLHVTNVDSEDMQNTLFNKTQLVFNKYRNLNRLLGQPVHTGFDITKVLDKKVIELMGEDPGVHFSDIRISGIINDDPDFEKAWFEDVQYSDTGKGQQIFLELINNIILGK